MHNQSASTNSSSTNSSSTNNFQNDSQPGFHNPFIFSIVDDKTAGNPQYTERSDMLVITKPTICKIEVQGVESEKNGQQLRTPASLECPNGIPYIRLKLKASDTHGNWALVSDLLLNNNTKRAWVVCKALGLAVSDFKNFDIRKLVGQVGYAEIEVKPYAAKNQDGGSTMKDGLVIKKWLLGVSHGEVEAAMREVNKASIQQQSSQQQTQEDEIPF